MSDARFVIKPNPGLSVEQARDARARAWKFIFDAYHRKAAGSSGGEDEVKLCKQKKEARMT